MCGGRALGLEQKRSLQERMDDRNMKAIEYDRPAGRRPMIFCMAAIVSSLAMTGLLVIVFQGEPMRLYAVPGSELLSASPKEELTNNREFDQHAFKLLFEKTPGAAFGSPQDSLTNVSDFFPFSGKTISLFVSQPTASPPPPTATSVLNSPPLPSPLVEKPWVVESRLPSQPFKPGSGHEEKEAGSWAFRVNGNSYPVTMGMASIF